MNINNNINNNLKYKKNSYINKYIFKEFPMFKNNIQQKYKINQKNICNLNNNIKKYFYKNDIFNNNNNNNNLVFKIKKKLNNNIFIKNYPNTTRHIIYDKQNYFINKSNSFKKESLINDNNSFIRKVSTCKNKSVDFFFLLKKSKSMKNLKVNKNKKTNFNNYNINLNKTTKSTLDINKIEMAILNKKEKPFEGNNYLKKIYKSLTNNNFIRKSDKNNNNKINNNIKSKYLLNNSYFPKNSLNNEIKQSFKFINKKGYIIKNKILTKQKNINKFNNKINNNFNIANNINNSINLKEICKKDIKKFKHIDSKSIKEFLNANHLLKFNSYTEKLNHFSNLNNSVVYEHRSFFSNEIGINCDNLNQFKNKNKTFYKRIKNDKNFPTKNF